MGNPAAQRVAVFDVDGTLLRGDCLWLAARRAKGPVGQLLAALACLPWLIGWQLRLVSTGRFKQQTIAAFGVCEAVSRAEGMGVADWLLDELRADLRPEALQRLRWHQQRGDRVLLCSASPRLLLQPLADWLEVELLCTELGQAQGQWRPRLSSPNCKGPEKVRRLEQHLGPLEGLVIEAYGDSRGDRELLQAAALPHYRSFLRDPRPHPTFSLGLIALVLLAVAAAGVVSLPAVQQQALLRALRALLVWLPVFYGLVALSYVGRYWRWRLLLGRLGIGRTDWPDLLVWFRGFALTATPAKVGELSRVQLLHEQLCYPRLPLVHVFVAERCADVAAVAVLLLVLTPAQMLGRLPSVSTSLLLVLLLVAMAVVLFARRPAPRRWIKGKWQHRRHHLPSGALARATVPAALISVLVWANEALVLWLLVRLLSPVSISIPAAIAIYLLSGTAGMASSLPGGIGVNEGATVLLLAEQGVPAAVALPIAVLRRLITLWSMVALAAAVGILPLSPQGQFRRDC